MHCGKRSPWQRPHDAALRAGDAKVPPRRLTAAGDVVNQLHQFRSAAAALVEPAQDELAHGRVLQDRLRGRFLFCGAPALGTDAHTIGC